MTSEERNTQKRKAQRIISELRSKWKSGELTEEQVSQLEALGITKHTIHDVVAGINDLATTCPELAAQWHPAKNGDLTPQDVKAGSHRKVWWQCEFGHEWETTIKIRSNGSGCPYCSGNKIFPGYNDLATTNPELAAQWHPSKNGDLTPQDVKKGSERKVWWQCDKGHEWEAEIRSRNNKGYGCPVCSGSNKPMLGYNDLATVNPELAAQWHPTKNGELTPQDVTAGSNKKVWWLGPCGHEWEAEIKSRNNNGYGCPVCSGRNKLKLGYNDLATVNPKLASQWHPTKNGELTPQDMTSGSQKKVWWQCEEGHEWEAVIASRVAGNGCPYCANRKVLPGYNDLATYSSDLAAQWHPTKNGDLTPQDVTAGSNKKVWWLGPCGHEWEAVIASRSNGSGCPTCYRNTRNKKEYVIAALRRKWQRGELTDDQVLQLESLGIPKHSAKDVTLGYNDLATTNPDLASQWHPTKNGDLAPQDVTAGSNKKVWWQCEKGHEWEALVTSRVSGSGCPYCANKKVLPGFNDLATTHPELAVQWQSEKNGDLTPQGVTAYSHKKVWWVCEKGHEWEAVIANRSKGIGCPYCSGKRAILGINDLATVSPDLATQWHPTKNGRLMPQDVMAGSGKKVWWLGECGHEWEATVRHRGNGTGCPYCSGHKVLPGNNDLATVNPELASQWHPTRNGGLTPQDVTAGSSKKVWWQCDKGHEWETAIANRSKGTGCPVCARKKKDDQR